MNKIKKAFAHPEQILPYLKRHWKSVIKWILIIALIVVIIVNFDTFRNLDVRGLVDRANNTFLAACIAILIYVLKTFTMVIPAIAIYIAVGLCFKPWVAMIVNTVGLMLELALGYWLGRFIGGDFIQKRLAKNSFTRKFLLNDLTSEETDETMPEGLAYANQKKEVLENKLLGHLDNKSGWIMAFLRLSPAPIDICSLFYGNIHYPFWEYMIWSMLGVWPYIMGFTLFGNMLYHM